ncbi:pheromone A receptor-domain-containing protein [Rhodocollybia butyracea]|uniref:Pheromone A receptor-domain-containing protein n=1 Tax=Rhodocollybia butyracea TaxID=206335 RepID=A0A9P5U9X0_9AGAR|nr:pheromone A receptor-domain-containing protein [Rhodocollybia butyracea]
MNFVVDTLFFAFSLLAFVLVFIPFPWHLKARNTGTCLFIVWTGLACLVFSIDSFLWRNSTSNFAPIWCDIAAKFLVGAGASVSSISLCINFRLWLIATDRVRILEKKFVLFIELLLGLGFPIVEMIFQYIVQERRFDIYEGFGCRPASDNVLLTYLFLLAPPLVIGIVSIIFCFMTIIAYHRIYKFMLDTHPSPTFHRRTTLSASFLWFLALGGLASLFSLVYFGFVVWLSATSTATSFMSPFKVWGAWDQMRGVVNGYTEDEWRGDTAEEILLEANRWIFVGLGLIFFLFFGFTSEARRRYRMLFGCGGRSNMLERNMRAEMAKSFVAGDLENATGYSTLLSTATLNLKNSIGMPQPVSTPTIKSPPEDPFRLDNPYPKHLPDKSKSAVTAPNSPAIHEILPQFGNSMTPPPSSPLSYPLMSLIPPNNASIYTQSTARESAISVDSSTPMISTSLAHRDFNIDTTSQSNGASGSGRHIVTASSPIQRARSSSDAFNRSRRPSARGRSVSRSRSTSVTAPPSGPLPPPPSEVPSTVAESQSQLLKNNLKRRATVASPDGDSAVARDLLARRGRAPSRGRSMERHLALAAPSELIDGRF